MADHLLDVVTAAQRLGVSRATLYRILTDSDGSRIGSVHIGRRRLIPASEVDRFIAAEMSGQAVSGG
jgi:excisionase family DNA binding protein